MKCQSPAVDESGGVDAGEKAGHVLVVDLWGRLSVPIVVLQELDEVVHVAASQIVRESLRNELVDELRDAVEHGSEW